MTTQKITKTALTNAIRRAKEVIEENKILKGDYSIQSATENSADFVITHDKKTIVRVIKGPEGEVGHKGLPGVVGSKGERGSGGIKGEQGVKGDIGAQGRSGEEGVIGESGVSGDQAIAFLVGPQGEQGIAGPEGKVGLKGIQGSVGNRGFEGIQGIIGKTGKPGINGKNGEIGSKGEHGDKGNIGDLPKHEWEDTRLRFQLPGKDRFGSDIWGRWVELSISSDGFLGKSGLIVNPAFSLPTTTKGDIVVHNGTEVIRLAVGADTQVLTADSAEPSGLKWGAGGGGSGSVTTIKEDGTQVGGADIVTLDFGTGFDISESPDTEVNITLDLNELGTETAIAAGDFLTMIDITDDGSQKITFANIESTLNHDSLAGFVSGEHFTEASITHTNITAGDGSDHTFLDQSVISGATPTFTSTNFTGISGITGLGAQAQDLNLNGNNIDNAGVIFLQEQADADIDVAASGQIWVNTAIPNELFFTDDAGNDREIIYVGGAFHDGFSDFIANEHTNHTSVTLTAGVGLSGGGDISANRTFTVDLNELGTETTIASGDFISMVDITDSGSQKITFANIESTLNHDSLAGFVADEHVAHAGVDIIAGVGLSGGGTIDSTRTLTVDLNELTTETTIAAGDFLTMVDITDSGSGKITLANLESTLNHDSLAGFVSNEHIDHTSITLTAGVGLSGGGDISTNRTFTVDLNELTTETTIAAGDFVVMVDITDSGSGKITLSNLEGAIDHDALTNFTTTEHYIQSAITETGALNVGSITSGFGNIDTGSSSITTTGTIAGITAANLVDKSAAETITGIWDFTGAAQILLPTADVAADSEIGIDLTPPSEFGDDILTWWGGTNIMTAVALAADQMPSGATEDGYHIKYDATANEFQLVAVAGGGNVSNTGTPADNQIAVWTDATTIEGTADFTFDGADFIFYNAANDGNPEIRIGAADAEELHIQTVFDSGAQTLDYVIFQTDAASATADKGEYRFNVDGSLIATIDDGGIELADAKSYFIDTSNVLSETTLGTSILTSSLTTVGALDSGSITSGFGSIDVGSSTITTTGALASGALTVTGDLIATGDADIQGGLLKMSVGGTTEIVLDALQTDAGARYLGFRNAGVAAPTANGSDGMKIHLFGTGAFVAASSYALGIQANAMWFNTDRDYRWYNSGTEKMVYDGVNDMFLLRDPVKLNVGQTSTGEKCRLYGTVGDNTTTARWGFGIEAFRFIMFMDPASDGQFSFRQTTTTSDPQQGVVAASIYADGGMSVHNPDEGGTANKKLQTVREVHTLSLATTSDTTINLASGAKLIGASFCVNTAVTDDAGDDTWSAEFHDGSSMHSLASGAAAAQNTKVNSLVDGTTISRVTDATTNIRFTPNGGSFSAGVIEVIVYYEDLTSLANV